MLLAQAAVDADQLQGDDPQPLGLEALQDGADQPALDTIGLEDDQGSLHGTREYSGISGDRSRSVVYSGGGVFATSSGPITCVRQPALDDPPVELLIRVVIQPPDADDRDLLEQRDDDPGHRTVMVLAEVGLAGHGLPGAGANGRSPGSPPRGCGARRRRRSGRCGRRHTGSRWRRRCAAGGTTRPAARSRRAARSTPAAPRGGSARPSRRGGRAGSPAASSRSGRGWVRSTVSSYAGGIE